MIGQFLTENVVHTGSSFHTTAEQCLIEPKLIEPILKGTEEEFCGIEYVEDYPLLQFIVINLSHGQFSCS